MQAEPLGTVDTQSGELILLDFGNLAFWSGTNQPVVHDDLVPPDVAESMRRSLDYEIVGPDAEEVADALDIAAVRGTYAFDVPDGAALAERVAAVCAGHGLDAQLRVIDRMPHRDRVRALLDGAPSGTEVVFDGIWAVAVRGLPLNHALAVYGERMDDQGPDRDRWKSVWVEVTSGEVESSQHVGHVLVDRARLMFADPDALASWNAGDPANGLVDLMFWGRDGETLAASLGADTFSEGDSQVYGWRDRPFDEIRELGTRLREQVEGMSARVAIDYRPHDDAHRILASMRESSSESGTVSVAGRKVCGFFTTWGDGAFPVYCDLGPDGQVIRIRVELGAPEVVARTRRMEELWFGDLSKLAIASPAVMNGAPIRWLERDDPRAERDSGWCVYAGTETQEELDDPGGASLVPLRDLIKSQPDLEPVFAASAPAAFELADDGTWQPIERSR